MSVKRPEFISKRVKDAGSAKSQRGEKQARSLARKERIVESAIEILALQGVSGLTHRNVASRAGVSLAATTYYFESKVDIITAASQLTLRSYTDSFHRVAPKLRASWDGPHLLRRFAAKLVCNAVERDRIRALCWAEITLGANRDNQVFDLARHWFSELNVVWVEIAEAAQLKDPHEHSRSAIDLVIGLLLVTLSLGLSVDQINSVLLGGENPIEEWKIAGLDESLAHPSRRLSSKSNETREKILTAAIDVLIAGGPDALAYRSVATHAGISAAGPYYHFPTINSLLAAAQARLFNDSKQRYRFVATEIGEITDVERLIDRTTTVLVRESTEFGNRNLASYAIWLQAARDPLLRPMIWNVVNDQHGAWNKLLLPLMPQQRALDPLLAFALFVGKHVRLICTGSKIEDLANIRREIARDFSSLIASDFWL